MVLNDRAIMGLGKRIKQRIINELAQIEEPVKPLLLNGLSNVWYVTPLVRNKVLSVTLVKTEVTQ